MGLLDSTKRDIVYRGFEYYKAGKVLDCQQIDEQRFSGVVLGSNENKYSVELNLKHPRTSFCSCPYAEGTKICKHMVALYFNIFPDEAEEYEECLYSTYEDYDEYDEEEMDDYDRRYYGRHYYEDDYDEYTSFQNNIPIYFNEILENYLNKLSKQDLKEIVRENLEKNRYSTFTRLLQNENEIYLSKHKDLAFVQALKDKLEKCVNRIDYNYYNSKVTIVNKDELVKIRKILSTNHEQKNTLKSILCNPKYAVFDQYLDVIKSLRFLLNDTERNEFIKKLQDYLGSLKNYQIKNTVPKSNVLIAIYEIGDFSLEQIAGSMAKNIKYAEYLQYMVDNTVDAKKLYRLIIQQLDNKQYYSYNGYIDHMTHAFVKRVDYGTLMNDLNYFDFLTNKSVDSLEKLIDKPEYMERLSHHKMTTEMKICLLAAQRNSDKLYELLVKENNLNLYHRYQEYVADKYSDELFELYRKNILNNLEKGMGREIYKNAISDLTYIQKLKDGNNLVDKFIGELKDSSHANKPALFDEIGKLLKKKMPRNLTKALF